MLRVLLTLFCFSSFAAFSQNQKDLEGRDVYTLLDFADKASQISLDSAFSINKIALRKAQLSKDWTAIFYTLRERGLYYEKYNRPNDAIPEYKKALEAIDSVKDKAALLPVAYTDLAIANRKCGQYDDCRTYHDRALALAISTKNLELEEDSYNGIGLLFETVSDWENAILYYQKSVAVAERRKNQEGVVISFQNIANVLSKSGAKKLAIEKINEAWRLAQTTDTIRQAHVLNDFGEILEQNGQLTEALVKFENSLTFYKRVGDQSMIARAMLNIAATLSAKGENQAALQKFEACQKMLSSFRKEELVKLYFEEATIFRKLNKPTEELESLYACEKLAETYNFREYLEKSNHLLAGICERNGDPTAAYLHLKKAYELAESIRNTEQQARIAASEFKYKAQKAENTIMTLESRNNRNLMWSFVSALLLVIAFLAFLFRQKVLHFRLLARKSDEIEASNQRLRESNQVLQQFAYATAHDLKEPLRTIGSFVGLLQRRHSTNFTPEAKEYLEIVRTGAHRMNDLLTDLLEYSTLFMDAPSANERTDFFCSLREVADNLRENIKERGVTLDLPEEKRLPMLTMKKSHLVQLLQNLVANAIKFSPINPHVQVSVVQENAGKLLISVKDNGIGIDPAYSDKIFQIFQRLDRQQFEGEGIGLSICKNVVEKYGGNIWFESELGKGTTFFVRLPVSVVNNAANQNATTAAPVLQDN